MIWAVFDANVLASGVLGFVLGTSTPGELLRRWFDGDFRLVISNEVLDELEHHVFASAYFRGRVPEPFQREILATLRRRYEVTALTAGIQGVESDPNNDHVLDAAVSKQSTHLVTGDQALPDLVFQDVSIATPRTFLDMFLAADPSQGGPRP